MANFKKKAIIDVETLDIWRSLTECAEALKVSKASVCRAILLGFRCSGKKPYHGGRKLEYFDYWLEAYTPAEKEKFTRKNNIFWL